MHNWICSPIILPITYQDFLFPFNFLCKYGRIFFICVAKYINVRNELFLDGRKALYDQNETVLVLSVRYTGPCCCLFGGQYAVCHWSDSQ